MRSESCLIHRYAPTNWHAYRVSALLYYTHGKNNNNNNNNSSFQFSCSLAWLTRTSLHLPPLAVARSLSLSVSPCTLLPKRVLLAIRAKCLAKLKEARAVKTKRSVQNVDFSPSSSFNLIKFNLGNSVATPTAPHNFCS